MPSNTLSLDEIRALNTTAKFNTWCAFEVLSAGEGRAELAMVPRQEQLQYSGYLHAGVVSALIDTACGFAATTVVGLVLASKNSVNYLRPAVGPRFVARALVVKAGRTQVFTTCELFALDATKESLVATGETRLVPVPRPDQR
mgnify:CR=1 FL=1